MLGFMRFMLESCFDLLLSSLICINMTNLDEINAVNFISDFLAYISLLPLIVAPLYFLKVIRIRLTGTEM